MHMKTGIGALCASIILATPVFAAVTITNQDSKSHTIVVDRGKSETKQDIAAGKSAQADCPDKCGFRDETYGFSRVAGGDSKLVIDKDSQLHFEGGKGDLIMPNGTN